MATSKSAPASTTTPEVVPEITALQQDVHNLTERCKKAFEAVQAKHGLNAGRIAALEKTVAEQATQIKRLLALSNAMSLRLETAQQDSRRQKFIEALNELRDELGLPGATLPAAQVEARMREIAARAAESKAPMQSAPEEEVF